jgi:MerR family transcriptional regulator, light-induced transcriptional regulator
VSDTLRRVPPPREERTLGIRDVAARTGVSEGTLRMWESRHGFPGPERLPSGHRRYSERDVQAVVAVVRAREQGLSLPVAIERARRLDEVPRGSVFGALRERFPELHPHALPKRILVRLSHALEDECCARADRPVLFASFQHARFYRSAESRWRELSRTAERAIVFADFRATRPPKNGPAEIALAHADELMREWVIVCDSPNAAACLVGWERPGGMGADRLFETIWTVDRAAVREAARVCVGLVRRIAPELVGDLEGRLADTPPPAGEELRLAVDLTTRMIDYAVDMPR